MSEPRKKITGPNFRLPGHMKCYFDKILDKHQRGVIKRLFIGAEVAAQDAKKRPLRIKDKEVKDKEVDA